MHLIARLLTGNRLITHAQGLENLPATGPAILAARHYHHLFDGLAFFAAVKRRFHIVVTLDWVRSRRSKFFMAALNRLARWPMVLREDAVRRGSGRRPFSVSDLRRYHRSALRQCIEILEDNRLLVIFPEGYPNIDPRFTPKKRLDEFLPFKPGFAVVAEQVERKTGRRIPIVPVGIRYETGRTWTAHLSFGEALFQRDFSSRRQLIDTVEAAAKKLSKP